MNEVVQKLARDILEKGYFFSLATKDDGGLWVSDVFYVSHGWNIYWLSARDTRHSKALEVYPDAAGTITITTSPSEPSEALQIAGRVEMVAQGDVAFVETLFLQKRGKEKKTEADRYAGGQSWYRLTPSKMRLAHQITFNLEKQDVDISAL